jgi:GNAT superfamily N-acetyltransferase
MSEGRDAATSAEAVVPLGADELDAAGSLFARAAYDDPCFSYLFPDPARRSRCLESFFRWCIRHGHVFGEAMRPAGALDGVMTVVRPAELAKIPERDQMVRSDYARVERELGEEACARLAREFYERIYAEASGALHELLDDAYWELDLLAVEPKRQGQGVGSALLRHLNRLADAADAQLGLLTFNCRNLPLYERHGYVVIGHETSKPSGVQWWSMGRQPRESSHPA